MQFLGKFGKIVCWRPPESWCPLLGEILDPPLVAELERHLREPPLRTQFPDLIFLENLAKSHAPYLPRARTTENPGSVPDDKEDLACR